MAANILEILKKLRGGGGEPSSPFSEPETPPPPFIPSPAVDVQERRLQRDVGETEAGPYRVPRSAAAYTEDDPDGRYQCSSCAAFQSPRTCLILRRSVSPTGTCFFWSRDGGGGKERISHPYTYTDVGYADHPDGFRCDLCENYQAGECRILAPPTVKPNGSCNLFVRSEQKEAHAARAQGGGLGDILVGEAVTPLEKPPMVPL